MVSTPASSISSTQACSFSINASNSFLLILFALGRIHINILVQTKKKINQIGPYIIINKKEYIVNFIKNPLYKLEGINKNSKKIDVVSFSRSPVIEKDRFMQKMEKFGLVSFVRNSDFKLKLKSSYNGEDYVWFHPVKQLNLRYYQ